MCGGGFQLFIHFILFGLLDELFFLFIYFEILDHHEVVQIAHYSNWIIKHVLILGRLWLGIPSSHILLFLLNSILLLNDYWLSQVVSVIYQFVIQKAVA